MGDWVRRCKRALNAWLRGWLDALERNVLKHLRLKVPDLFATRVLGTLFSPSLSPCHRLMTPRLASPLL